MATTLVKSFQSNVINRLDTYNLTVPTTNTYSVDVQMTELPPSGLSIVIEKNSSPVASSAAPAATQGILDLQTKINCTASDVISVVISSSNVNDEQLNTVKGLINIREGLV